MCTPYLRDAAELSPRRVPRIGWRQSRCSEVALRQLEVCLDLVVELAVVAAESDEREQALKGTSRAHAFASRNRATSALACSQLVTSTWSCLAPAWVSA